MKASSPDLRQRVLADCDAGMATDEGAAKYRVSASWIRRLKRRRRETGSTAPKPQRHGPKPGWADHADRIAEAVRQTPDATLDEHRQRLGLGFSASTLWRALKALGLTVKKKVLRAAEQGRVAVGGQRGGKAEVGFAALARPGQLRPLLRPRRAAAGEHPPRADARVVALTAEQCRVAVR